VLVKVFALTNRSNPPVKRCPSSTLDYDLSKSHSCIGAHSAIGDSWYFFVKKDLLETTSTDSN